CTRVYSGSYYYIMFDYW
nr:immunoglobulin heavy chain junction region [Macaca mulatta]MOW19563.1 immunoglobulin heavy chain junction region [Macaca mulatta]MOW19988.1 immunoglobulin heavy chain junction region [Macaca mulatta]MOW20378.1 immunoglobulin heavy chain junction region [Macaca mulatta]MOW20902.1 immunoglobulin heavy chain junction region [Macaca mulatta]